MSLQEGDEDRLDQQMGDVGDNEEVVDEKLWDGDDDEGEEEGSKKKEKYEKDSTIQVRATVVRPLYDGIEAGASLVSAVQYCSCGRQAL